MDDSEEVAAEIEHVPSGGIKAEIPTDRPQLPRAAVPGPSVIVPTGIPEDNRGRQPVLPPAENRENETAQE